LARHGGVVCNLGSNIGGVSIGDFSALRDPFKKTNSIKKDHMHDAPAPAAAETQRRQQQRNLLAQGGVRLLSGGGVRCGVGPARPFIHSIAGLSPMADLDGFFSAKDKKKKKKSKKKREADAAEQAERARNPTVTIVTSAGTIEVELYLSRVPLTVSNFVDLCQTGFFTGLAFHRVIEGFMLQFGCPNTRTAATMAHAGKGNAPPNSEFVELHSGERLRRSPEGTITDEFTSRDSNLSMTLSMANTGARHSGGSQFFINLAANTNLDWFSEDSPASRHPVFGKVVQGEEVVMKISKMPTNSQDRPARPIRVTATEVSIPAQPMAEPEPEPQF
jgi:cyclophilin family peptidyl-prolyl cis-trans isomerase